MSAGLSHERLEELIAADVLDGLEEPERAEMLAGMAAHGPDCPECRRLVAEYREVASRLAGAPDPEPVSAVAEERLIRAARQERLPAVGAAGKDRRTRRWVALVAAAAVIAALAGAVGYLLAPGPSGTQQALLELIAHPDTKVVSFPTHDGQNLAMAYRPGSTRGFVVASNLPPLSGNKIYEVWFQPTGSSRMEPAGTFTSNGGTVISEVTLGPSIQALAVSVEPGRQDQPTTQPIFIQQV